jgi:hypothetical protein
MNTCAANPGYPFHPIVTAVSRKRDRDFTESVTE